MDLNMRPHLSLPSARQQQRRCNALFGGSSHAAPRPTSLLELPTKPSVFGFSLRPPARRSVRVGGLFDTRTRVAEETTTKWWQQGKELWVEVKTLAEFDKEVMHADRLVVVDWFATWCHGCERSFPEVCKVAQDPEMRKTFKFVKICVENMQAFSRAQGISALPRVSVYKPGEGQLVSIDVPFSRVKHLKTNLLVIKGNPGKSYALDPNGFVIPTDKAVATQAKEDKAKEAAALSSSGSGLFEHLMAVANKKPQEKAPSPSTSTSTSTSPSTSTSAPPSTSSSNAAAGPARLAPPPGQESGEAAGGWPSSLNLGHMYCLDKQAFMMRYGSQYGYNGRIDALYPAEVAPRMKPNEHYLDYTGSSVYCTSQLNAVFQDLQSHMFGNPHSANPSSQLTSQLIDDVRLQLLNFFNADPQEYQVIFTKSATGALKLLGETFPWTQDSLFRYLRENHNSVLGVREYALQHGAHFEALAEESVERWLASPAPEQDKSRAEAGQGPSASLFAFPAEDNFAGVKYPLSWIKAVQAKSTPDSQWLVLLDAAAYVPTQPLDLTAYPADFVDVAFYKMFGYPTGLGALLVRTEAAALLRKVFWGGGTVALATASDNFHVLKCKPSDKFENGTVDFLDIIALKHGLSMIDNLGGMKSIQMHTGALVQWTFERMATLKHSNGKPLVAIFGKHHLPESHLVQGPIINFEVLQPSGDVFSYKTFEREAADAGFHVRTGTECNPGACYAYLGVKESEIETLMGKKEGCNDDVEWLKVERPQTAKQVIHSSDILQSISNKSLGLGHPAEVAMKWVDVPLGSIRVSLGYMSTFEDCWAFVDFIVSKYKDRQMGEDDVHTQN